MKAMPHFKAVRFVSRSSTSIATMQEVSADKPIISPLGANKSARRLQLIDDAQKFDKSIQTITDLKHLDPLSKINLFERLMEIVCKLVAPGELINHVESTVNGGVKALSEWMNEIVSDFEKSAANLYRSVAMQEFYKLSDKVMSGLRTVLGHSFDPTTGKYIRLEMYPGVPIPMTSSTGAIAKFREAQDYTHIKPISGYRGAQRCFEELIKTEVKHILTFFKDQIVWFSDGAYHWFWGRTVDGANLSDEVSGTHSVVQCFNLFHRIHETRNCVRQFSVQAGEHSDIVKELTLKGAKEMVALKNHVDENGIMHHHHYYEKGDMSWESHILGTSGCSGRRPHPQLNLRKDHADTLAFPVVGIWGDDDVDIKRYNPEMRLQEWAVIEKYAEDHSVEWANLKQSQIQQHLCDYADSRGHSITHQPLTEFDFIDDPMHLEHSAIKHEILFYGSL
eukprot:Lithocolla_globosa_v1_NODE_139_length_5801_cov_6.461364.p1 type:complete len:449 gc:universal NODE_139_length_5801_cov_6.461364:3984-2638(-)